MSPTSYRTALPRDIAFRSQRRIYYSTDPPTLSIANSHFFVKFADSARFQLLPRWFAAVNAPKTRGAGFGSGGAVPQSLIEPSAVGYSPTGKPAGLPPCRRNPKDFRRLVATRLCRGATAIDSRQKNCVHTAIYGFLSLSHRYAMPAPPSGGAKKQS